MSDKVIKGAEPDFALSLFQSACNWIQNRVIYGSGCNKPHLWKHKQVFGGCKRERREAASSFCLLQGMVELLLLQIRVCLFHVFVFWKQQEHTWGKANMAGCLHSKLSLYFSSYCGTFQDRASVGNGNQTNFQHLKHLKFCCILGQFPDKSLQFSKGIMLDNYYKEANDF